MACKEITVYIFYPGHQHYHSLVFPFIYLLDKMDIEEYKKLARNKIEADTKITNKNNKMAKTRYAGRF